MRTVNRHLIQRQTLELELASVEQAAYVQDQAARPFRGQSLPELERLFDRIAGPRELVRLERLEIDLGSLQGPAWREELVERLVERLRASLERVRPAAGVERPPDSGRESVAGRAFEQFLFFLVHGRLPWWGSKPASGWGAALPRELGPERWRALADLLRESGPARARLITEMDDEFLSGAVRALTGHDFARQVVERLAPAADAVPARRWRRRAWSIALAFAASGGLDAERGPELVGALLVERRRLESAAGSPPSPPAGPDGRRRESPAPVEDVSLPAPWDGWLARALERSGGASAAAARPPATPAGARTDAGLTPADASRGRRAGPGADGRVLAERPRIAPEPGAPSIADRPVREPGLGPRSSSGVSDQEAVYVDGAGIVLVHPFLEELFGSRDLLLESRTFRDPAARAHAVHLLGYLTFGAADAPEYELLLPKLLCAMPWDEPLPEAELVAGDRQACDELLTAVVGHWRALGTASPSWLRQHFFLRDGKLQRVDDGWKLTVEGQGQDVLLARLPWGVGLVRLPWARELLHVSWAE